MSPDETLASRNDCASDSKDRVIVSARVFADVPAPGFLPSDGAKYGRSGDGRWFASFRIKRDRGSRF